MLGARTQASHKTHVKVAIQAGWSWDLQPESEVMDPSHKEDAGHTMQSGFSLPRDPPPMRGYGTVPQPSGITVAPWIWEANDLASER